MSTRMCWMPAGRLIAITWRPKKSAEDDLLLVTLGRKGGEPIVAHPRAKPRHAGALTRAAPAGFECGCARIIFCPDAVVDVAFLVELSCPAKCPLRVPVGSITAEATDSARNIRVEAIRDPVPDVGRQYCSAVDLGKITETREGIPMCAG